MKELSQPIATTFMLPAVWAELYVAEMVAVEVGTAELTWTNFICAAACCDAHKSNDQLMTTRRKDWTKSTFNIRRKDKCDIENSRYPTHLRSEERRVGKECRSRWSLYHSKKKESRGRERG